MKILMLNHNHENYGTYYRCFFLAKSLSKLGHKVTLVCASGRNFDILIRKKKINEHFDIITLPRIKYHKFFTGQSFRGLISIFQVLFKQYDIIHAFTVAQPQIGIPAYIAKKVRSKKLIIDWDDMWGGGFAEYHPRPVKKVLTFFERGLPKYADHVTYVSEFIGKELDSLGIKNKSKIPNGCNTEQIKPLDKNECRKKLGIETDDKVLVAIGNTYMGSLQILFKAFKYALEKEPRLHLYLVGCVDIPNEYLDLYKSIKDNVILTGPRPFEEVPLYMGASDTLILPMEDGSIEKARFPIRLGDYLCANKPIVSNAVGEVKYYIENYNCGLTCDVNDFKKLGDNILYVLDNDLYSKNCTNLAYGELSWDNIAQKLSKVYI